MSPTDCRLFDERKDRAERTERAEVTPRAPDLRGRKRVVGKSGTTQTSFCNNCVLPTPRPPVELKNKYKETLYTHPATERTTGTFGSWSLFYRLQKSVFPHPRHFILIPLHPCPEGIYFKRTKQNLTGAAEG